MTKRTANKSAIGRYVLMPTHGLRFDKSVAGKSTISAMASMAAISPGKQWHADSVKLRVLHSIREDGVKLVEATQDQILKFRADNPGVRAVPEVFYYPAVVARPQVRTQATAAGTALSTKISVKVVSKTDGSPIPNATVVAFTNFAQRAGASGVTSSQGKASLKFDGPISPIERLYIYPKGAYWSSLTQNVSLSDGMKLPLQPIDFTQTDCVRHFYGNPSAGQKLGKGIVVGVIDSGIDLAHPDLVVAGGFNTVPGEQSGDFGDNGTEGHGTHVAGIIAARGTTPEKVRGVAPNVELRSFRVFGQGEDGASNFSIAAAIDEAVAQGCDLLNLSLGGGAADPVLHSAISHARQSGVALFIAAGNDGRQPVSNPARDALTVAVSAMGLKSLIPAKTAEASDISPPFGTDPDEFVAAFSNIGPEIDVTGPGVGVVSTIPGGYGIMSGTSMACPAVTGVAARIISDSAVPTARDAARSAAILQKVFAACKTRGFGADFEGQGLPLH